MKRRAVGYAEEAEADLLAIYDWVAATAGWSTAHRYVARIKDYCDAFCLAAERGRRRDDLRPGLRIAGFERRVTIAFTMDDGA